jgi:hypothetical protein
LVEVNTVLDELNGAVADEDLAAAAETAQQLREVIAGLEPTGGVRPPTVGSAMRARALEARPAPVLRGLREREPGLYSPPEPFSHRSRVLRGGHRPAFFSAASRCG